MREYIWIDDRPVAVVANIATAPVLYHLHTDHLNRPIAMTDGAKQEVWRATYLPFGAVSSITGTASLDMRFPGQWFQLETGFHHNWHRTYDPTTGRYLQPDPLGMPDGPSRWAYARSAPTMYVDPTGRIAPLAIALGIWAGVEIGLTAYDLYSLANVWLDPCSTNLDRGIATAATAAGIFLPGAGYSAAARFADNSRLLNHFTRHGGDFGATSAVEYQRMASEFLTGPRNPSTLEHVRSNGDIVRFDPSSDSFGVITSNGTVRTFFKPDPRTHGYPTNLEYFYAQ